MGFERIQEKGILENSRYELEENSTTTVGNAVWCVPILRRASVTHIDLISSEFHLPRAMYFFEAVLAAHQLQISIVPIPATTPPPSPSDEGINVQTLKQRIMGEESFCSTKSDKLELQLDKFNPNKMVPIRPPPPARKEQ